MQYALQDTDGLAGKSAVIHLQSLRSMRVSSLWLQFRFGVSPIVSLVSSLWLQFHSGVST